MSSTTTVDEQVDDSKLQDIILHLQQLLLSDNVLTSTTNTSTSSRHQGGAGANRLASSDDYLDQLALIVRDALTNNQTDELRSGLDSITKSKDQEIENLCNGNQNVCIKIFEIFKIREESLLSCLV